MTSLVIHIVCYALAVYWTAVGYFYVKIVAHSAGAFAVAEQLPGFYAFMVVLVLAAARRKEWARRGVVALGFFLSCYLLIVFVYVPDLVSITNIYVHMIAVIFFNYPKVREFYASGPGRKSGKVLVVDDDLGVHKIVASVLKANGFAVLSAMTGEEGLKIALAQRPDVILMDVILPGKKGREVCSQLKAHKDTQDIPVIFLTAKDSADDIDAELKAGAYAHLTKPVHPKRLMEKIVTVIGS